MKKYIMYIGKNCVVPNTTNNSVWSKQELIDEFNKLDNKTVYNSNNEFPLVSMIFLLTSMIPKEIHCLNYILFYCPIY